MSVTDDTGTSDSATTSSEKDVLLIVASVSMALATIALILIVRLLERCLPDADREESARALEKKAQKMRELIDRHTHLLTYSQWLSKMREKYGLPLSSASRSSSRQGSRALDLVDSTSSNAKSLSLQPQPTSVSVTVSSGAALQAPPSGAAAEDCAVCLTEFSVDERIREISFCSHIFHEECLHGWFVKSKKPICPLCRYNLQNARIEELDDANQASDEANNNNNASTTAPAGQTTDRPSSSSNARPSQIGNDDTDEQSRQRETGIPMHFITEFV